MLNPNDEVFVVARQSKIKPGGSAVTPNIVFKYIGKIVISVRQYTLPTYGWLLQHPWKKYRNYFNSFDAFTCTKYDTSTSCC